MPDPVPFHALKAALALPPGGPAPSPWSTPPPFRRISHAQGPPRSPRVRPVAATSPAYYHSPHELLPIQSPNTLETIEKAFDAARPPEASGPRVSAMYQFFAGRETEFGYRKELTREQERSIWARLAGAMTTLPAPPDAGTADSDRIQVGDVVQLNSGGPKMTVINTVSKPPHEGRPIETMWFNNENTHTGLNQGPIELGAFPEAALKRIGPAAAKVEAVKAGPPKETQEPELFVIQSPWTPEQEETWCQTAERWLAEWGWPVNRWQSRTGRTTLELSSPTGNLEVFTSKSRRGALELALRDKAPTGNLMIVRRA